MSPAAVPYSKPSPTWSQAGIHGINETGDDYDIWGRRPTRSAQRERPHYSQLPDGLSRDARGAPWAATCRATLSGEWVGTGTLFGQTAEFRMQWNEAKEGKTLFLHFENWILDGDERQPILEALARYSPQEPSQLEGLWIDTRGKRLRLSAEVHEHSLVVFWQGPDEEGKTEYEVISRDAIQVRDFVKQPEGWSQFGMANYRRAVPSDGRPGP